MRPHLTLPVLLAIAASTLVGNIGCGAGPAASGQLAAPVPLADRTDPSAGPGPTAEDLPLAEQIQRLRGAPSGRDVRNIREALVRAAIDPDAPDATTVFYRIVTEKQRLDARSVFGLTREERYLSENLRQLLLAIGSPRSLHALRPDASDHVEPLLTWTAARLDPDQRRQAAREELVVEQANRHVRSQAGQAVADMLQHLALWLAPDPARPRRVKILPLEPADGLALAATTREALEHALSDVIREIPGLDLERGAAEPQWLLRVQPGVSGLFIECLAADNHSLAWAGHTLWDSAARPDVARQLEAAAEHAGRIGLALDALDALDAARRAGRLGAWREPLHCRVLPFAATDEAGWLARAVRQQVIAELSTQRRLHCTDAAAADLQPSEPGGPPDAELPPVVAFGTHPEQNARFAGDDARFLIGGRIEGQWRRGRFVGRCALQVLDRDNDLQPVWQADAWAGLPAAGAPPQTPGIDNQPSAQ